MAFEDDVLFLVSGGSGLLVDQKVVLSGTNVSDKLSKGPVDESKTPVFIVV